MTRDVINKGVSNWQISNLQRWKEKGYELPAVNQVEAHIGYLEDDLNDYCQQNGILLQVRNVNLHEHERTLMGCTNPPHDRGRSTPPMSARGCSLLYEIYADVRHSEDSRHHHCRQRRRSLETTQCLSRLGPTRLSQRWQPSTTNRLPKFRCVT